MKTWVNEHAALLYAGTDPAHRRQVLVEYEVLEHWRFLARTDVNSPVSGPLHVEVHPAWDAESINNASDEGGVTREVLRAVPLMDARRRLRDLRAEELAK